MTDEKFELVFSPPSENSPGYLLRLKRSLEFQNVINKAKEEGTSLDAGQVDLMVEFLIDFIANDVSDEIKRDVLWNLSEAQFNQLMALASGSAEEPEENGEGN